MILKTSSCEDGLKKIIIEKDVFEREIAMCQKLSKKNKGHCNWGKCKNCGVIFLLEKLYKGKLIENKNEIKKFRKKILNCLDSSVVEQLHGKE